MRKIFIAILVGTLILNLLGCQKQPEEISNSYVEEAESEVTEKVRESDSNSEELKSEEDYYMMFTSLTAEEVEQFAEEIKSDILENNWEALAEKISYPIVISGITVTNRDEFLKLDVDGKLNQEFVEAIRAETCRKMFCNWQGVMMGETGQIWFSNVENGEGTSELLIIGINDMLEI